MKWFLQLFMGASLVFPSVAMAADQITLRIANYGGLFTQSTQRCTADLFTKRTGIAVTWIDGNPTDHLARLIANQGSEPPFDLAYIDDPVQAEGIKAGVLEKIDPAAIPNLAHLYPVAVNKENYGPAVNLFSVGLAYNAKIFADKGIPEPTSWADLWDPRLAGHVALPDITGTAGMEMVVVGAWLTGGDEKDVKDAFKKLSEIKPLYFYKSSSDLKAKFLSGDAWAAPWYNGRAWDMVNSGFPLKYIFPREGGFGMTTRIDIAKGTKRAKEAMQYINMALDPLPQLCQAYEVPYGPTNQTLATVMKTYPKLSEQFPSSVEDLKHLYLPDWNAINEQYPNWLEAWNRNVVR